MPLNFEFFHKELLKKSKKYKKIEVLLETNGILKMKKPKLDIFTFIEGIKHKTSAWLVSLIIKETFSFFIISTNISSSNESL